jgi:hypothetical protein
MEKTITVSINEHAEQLPEIFGLTREAVDRLVKEVLEITGNNESTVGEVILTITSKYSDNHLALALITHGAIGVIKAMEERAARSLMGMIKEAGVSCDCDSCSDKACPQNKNNGGMVQ